MKIIILGAGVIGTTTAYYLAKAKHEVHVIDRQPEAAMETSFANGCVLHTSEAEPWSRPGMPRAVLSWLGKNDAPMLLRLRALPSMWQWGINFVRHCTVEHYRRAVAVNLRLANHTLAVISALRTETGLEYDHAQHGTLKIYTRQEALDKNAAESLLQAPLGLVYEIADANRCVTLEPALAPIRNTLVGGIYAPRDEQGDCRKFTVGLRQYCEAKLGVTFHLNTNIQRIVRLRDRVESVETSKGGFSGDRYVVALASYSSAILASLGVKASIYPAKGITVTVPDDEWADGPRMPVIDDTRLFGFNHIGRFYRLSGSVEFNGWDTRPNPARVQAMIANVLGVFPGFARCYREQTAKVWAGLRPMPSSGTPYIGVTTLRNLYLNSGHGHLGWTLACGSSQLLADLIADRATAIDMTGLTPATHL
jgi:D-amino-acid dehydrogenase